MATNSEVDSIDGKCSYRPPEKTWKVPLMLFALTFAAWFAQDAYKRSVERKNVTRVLLVEIHEEDGHSVSENGQTRERANLREELGDWLHVDLLVTHDRVDMQGHQLRAHLGQHKRQLPTAGRVLRDPRKLTDRCSPSQDRIPISIASS